MSSIKTFFTKAAARVMGSWLITLIKDHWANEEQTFINSIEDDYQQASEALQESLFAVGQGYKVGSENNAVVLTTAGLARIRVVNGVIADGATAQYLPEGAVITLGGAQSYTPVTVDTDQEDEVYGLCDATGTELLTTDGKAVYHENAGHTGGSWVTEAVQVVYGRNIYYAGGDETVTE